MRTTAEQELTQEQYAHQRTAQLLVGVRAELAEATNKMVSLRAWHNVRTGDQTGGKRAHDCESVDLQLLQSQTQLKQLSKANYGLQKQLAEAKAALEEATIQMMHKYQ